MLSLLYSLTPRRSNSASPIVGRMAFLGQIESKPFSSQPKKYEPLIKFRHGFNSDLRHKVSSKSLESVGALKTLEIACKARAVDAIQQEWTQGRIKFAILGAGQELPQILMVNQKPAWMSGYYRDLAATLASGALSEQHVFAQALGDAEPGHDPASNGRMMAHHFGDRALNSDGSLANMAGKIRIASRSSALGSQMPAVYGIGVSLKGTGQFNVAFIGDSSCAEGVFWESLNQIAIAQCPTVIMVMDNGMGITVPVEKQVAHGNISKAASGIIKTLGPVDGWDYQAVKKACSDAAASAKNDVPVLVHVKVTRPHGHSSTGGTRADSLELKQFNQEYDGIEHLKQAIKDQGWADDAQINQVIQGAQAYVREASEQAWQHYYQPIVDLAKNCVQVFQQVSESPALTDSDLKLVAKKIIARSELTANVALTRYELHQFMQQVLLTLHRGGGEASHVQQVVAWINAQQSASVTRWSSDVFASEKFSAKSVLVVEPTYPTSQQKMDTLAHIIGAGLSTLLSKDPELCIFGQDAGQLGGVSTCTLGLQSGVEQSVSGDWKKAPALEQYLPEKGFGADRVFDTAISEAVGIIGLALGRALVGKASIAEIQYVDYMPYALQQLIDEVASLRHRTAGGQQAPMLIRTHGHRQLGMWHSGSPMGLLMSIPGLHILVPRSGVQASRLYQAVMQGKDPAVSVEPLNEMYAKEAVPDNLDQATLPVGHAEIIVDTTDGVDDANQCTVVTYGGSCCRISGQVAADLKKEGIGIKVVDLQTLSPLDVNGVAKAAIRATGKVVWFDEDYPNGAMSFIAKELLHGGDNPDEKLIYAIESETFLTARPHKPAYGADGGAYSKPQAEDVQLAVLKVLDAADGGKRLPPGLLSREAIERRILK